VITYVKVDTKEQVAEKFAEIMENPPFRVGAGSGVMSAPIDRIAYIFSYEIAPGTYGASKDCIQIWCPE
jgi:hypothetical protein